MAAGALGNTGSSFSAIGFAVLAAMLLLAGAATFFTRRRSAP
jgi:LPXTG-motif cell wall-anchored protein